MTNLKDVKEAIVSVKDGTLEIIFGYNLNKTNINFHDRVEIEFGEGPEVEILVKGHLIREEKISDTIDSSHAKFEFFKENLVDFSKAVKKTESKISLFKKTNPPSEYVVNSAYGTRYVYKSKFWKPREYRTNNWTITEFKKPENE